MLARDPVKTTNMFSSLVHAAPVHQTSKASDALQHPDDSQKKKKKKKKKKKATPEHDQEITSDNESTVSTTSQTPPSTAEASSPDPSQLPLAQRLEMAASHPDVHAALVGLVGWSRLYVHSDTIMTLFECHALEKLFENIWHATHLTDAVFENLHTLLVNGLSIERQENQASQDIATAVVSTVRALAQTLQKPQPTTTVPSISTSKIASQLSKLIVQYRLSMNGVDGESELSKAVMRIDAELTRAAKRDGSIQGQSIREAFQRRDVRSDALALYADRLDKMQKLIQESTRAVSPSQAKKTSQPVPFVLFEDHEAPDTKPVDAAQVEVIQQQLTALNERKKARLAPLEQTKATQSTKLTQLKTQRGELEAKLRALNHEIHDLVASQTDIETQMEAIEQEFANETAEFDHEHQQIIARYHQKQTCDEIEATLRSLDTDLRQITLENSQVQSLKDKLATCLRQQLEGTLRYFATQVPCVKFMKQRVLEMETKLQTLVDEAETYKALGVGAVAKELVSQTNELQGLLEEDKKCFQALQTRDVEVFALVDRLLSDPLFGETLNQLNPQLITDVQRHVDHVRSLHEGTHASTTK